MRQRYPGSAFTLGDSPTGLYSAHPGWWWPAAKRMSCPRRWQRRRSRRRLARSSASVHQALSEIDSERMAGDGRAARPAEARYPLHRYKAGTTKALTAELEVLGAQAPTPRRHGNVLQAQIGVPSVSLAPTLRWRRRATPASHSVPRRFRLIFTDRGVNGSSRCSMAPSAPALP